MPQTQNIQNFLDEFQLPTKIPRTRHLYPADPSIRSMLVISSPNILSDFLDPLHHYNAKSTYSYFQSCVQLLIEYFSGFSPIPSLDNLTSQFSHSSMVPLLFKLQEIDPLSFHEFDINAFFTIFNLFGNTENHTLLSTTLINKASMNNIPNPIYTSLLNFLKKFHDIPIPIFIPSHLLPRLQPEFSAVLYSTLDPPEITLSNNLIPISPDLLSQWQSPSDSSLMNGILGSPFKVDFVSQNNQVKLVISIIAPETPDHAPDEQSELLARPQDSLYNPIDQTPIDDESLAFPYHQKHHQHQHRLNSSSLHNAKHGNQDHNNPSQSNNADHHPFGFHPQNLMEKYTDAEYAIGNIPIPSDTLEEQEFVRDIEDILTEAKESTLSFIESILADPHPDKLSENSQGEDPHTTQNIESNNTPDIDESKSTDFSISMVTVPSLFSSDDDSESSDMSDTSDQSESDNDSDSDTEVSLVSSEPTEPPTDGSILTEESESPFDLDGSTTKSTNTNTLFMNNPQIQELLAQLNVSPLQNHGEGFQDATLHPNLDSETDQEQWAIVDRIEDVDAAFVEHVPKPALIHPFPLDDFQKEAIIHVEQGHCVFVAAHTSAGKTVVAEYAIAHCKSQLSRAIYTSPIKALSNQKFRDFRKMFDDDVGIITGDITVDEDSSCLIMTTEILRSMLYRGADLLRDVEWVIFDEVHYLNDPERGVVWEEVLILLPPHIHVILLSATVPNVFQLAEWIGRTRRQQVYLISTLKRPVPLEYYLYVPSKHGAVLWDPHSQTEQNVQEFEDDEIVMLLEEKRQLAQKIQELSNNGKKTSPEIRKNQRELSRLEETIFRTRRKNYKAFQQKLLDEESESESGSGSDSSKSKKIQPIIDEELFKICDSDLHFVPEVYFAAKRAAEADKNKKPLPIPPRNKNTTVDSKHKLLSLDTTTAHNKSISSKTYLTTSTNQSLNPFKAHTNTTVDPSAKSLRTKLGEKPILKKSGSSSGSSSSSSTSLSITNGSHGFIGSKMKKKRLTSKTTRPVQPGDPSPDSHNNAWLGVVRMCQKNSLLPIVVFSYSRSKCEDCASKLYGIDLLTSPEKAKVHVHLHRVLSRLKGTDKELPQIKTVTNLLLRGIGVHHSGIMPIVKELVEMCFAASLCKILFATETFALGVNMPARSVFFNGIKKFDGKTFRFLNPAEFTQTTGRAGRRGRDVVGTVMIGCWGNMVPDLDVIKQIMLSRPEKLESKFRLTYYMMLNVFRNNELSISDVIKSSFSEFSRQKLLIPTHILDKARVALEKLRGGWETHCSQVQDYYLLQKKYKTGFNSWRKMLFSNPKTLKKMSPGQVITISPSATFSYVLFPIGVIQNSITTGTGVPLNSKQDSHTNFNLVGTMDSFLQDPKNLDSNLTHFSNSKSFNAVIIAPDLGKWLFRMSEKVYSTLETPSSASRQVISPDGDGVTSTSTSASGLDQKQKLDPSLQITKLAVEEIDSATKKQLENSKHVPLTLSQISKENQILENTLYTIFARDSHLFICSISLSSIHSLSSHASNLSVTQLYSMYQNSIQIQNREKLALSQIDVQQNLTASVFDSIADDSLKSAIYPTVIQTTQPPEIPTSTSSSREHLDIPLNVAEPIDSTDGPVPIPKEKHPFAEDIDLPEIPEEEPIYIPSKRPTGLAVVKHVDFLFPIVEYCFNVCTELDHSISVADPYQLSINDPVILDLWNEMSVLQASMNSLSCANCPLLISHLDAISTYDKLKQNIELLAFAASDNALALKPEYEARVQVLTELGFIDNLRMIQLKGRLACEISSCEVMIATEMILENVFDELNPAECVALLSCLVFQDRKSQVVPPENVPNNLALACHKTRDLANNVGTIQMEYGLVDSPSKYVQEHINMGLVEVVYRWALGEEFLNLLSLTDVPEGVIIRIISRLNEICRQFCAAARSIGNSKIFENFEEASILIKRDVVFCVSLYI